MGAIVCAAGIVVVIVSVYCALTQPGGVLYLIAGFGGVAAVVDGIRRGRGATR